MAKSFINIDYRIRVAKSVERRLMCSLFQNLAIFYPLKEYQYIGMGSVAFIDFVLFHKVLGIEKMTSIEADKSNLDRFKFNKPYEFIKMVNKQSGDVIPYVDLSEPTIMWLDYDGKLETYMLDDISTALRRMRAGSIFCLSYNAQPDGFHDAKDTNKDRYRLLSKKIDSKYFPEDLTEHSSLNKKGLRETYYKIIKNVVDEAIRQRKSLKEDILIKQVLYFNYADGAEMNTIGWVLYDSSQEEKMEMLHSLNIPFLKNEQDTFQISVPKLTYKEMKEIETQFPNLEECINKFEKNKTTGFLEQSDIESYFNIYKHFSLFAEINL